MPHGYQIRLLNPSSPQYGYRTAFIEQIRGLLDYSHPRFYAALVAIQAEPLAQERKGYANDFAGRGGECPSTAGRRTYWLFHFSRCFS